MENARIYSLQCKLLRRLVEYCNRTRANLVFSLIFYRNEKLQPQAEIAVSGVIPSSYDSLLFFPKLNAPRILHIVHVFICTAYDAMQYVWKYERQ